MRPRWRKVYADWWSNISRFILVTLSLTGGLFSIGIIAGGYVTTLNDMQVGFHNINPAEIRIRTEAFDDKLLEQVLGLDGVVAAEGEKMFFVQLRTAEGEWQDIIIRVLPEGTQNINRVELLEGRMPAEQEIIFDIHRELDHRIGAQVTIQTATGLQRDMVFSGIVRDQTIGVLGSSYFIAPVYGYVTHDTLPWLQQEESYDVLVVRVDPELSADAYKTLKEDLSGLVEQSGRYVFTITDLRNAEHPNSGYVRAVSNLLALLGFLSVFLSGFLVYNAMAALLAQQMQHIGILKSIGARQSSIIKMYMIFILAFGVIALLISVPLSAWAAEALSQFLGLRLNFRAGGMRLVPIAVIVQTAIALLLPQAAGILPILKASQVSVQEAINSTGIQTDDFGKSWLDRRLENIKGVGRPLLISLRNTFRRKSRLVLTLITLSLAGAVFIATFNVRASVEKYIDKVSAYILADVNLDFEQNYRINEIESIAKTIPGVIRVEPRSAATAQLLNDNGEALETVEIWGTPPESSTIKPIILNGRWIVAGDQNAIVLNEAFVTYYPDLKVGDTVNFKIKHREVSFVVIGFFQFIGSDFFLAYTPIDYLNLASGNRNKAANYQVVADASLVAQNKEDDLARKLDEVFRSNGFSIRNATTSKSIRGNATLGLDTMTFFLLIMSGLTALVGSISLTGTMGMNVMERTREIGVIRAIGA
ncbi:MAG: FtsX-like permease family protein, partial [Dethiobacteria bacterium]|nr:FtsX-like permease family protein [Dethiobacteria bacterium]